MLESLDFLYVPSADPDGAATRCVEGLGGTLVWRIAEMGAVVSAVRVSVDGPLVLFADHLDSETAIPIYRVGDLAAALGRLGATGAVEIRRLEIPPGPCATFSIAGSRLGVYELTRPHAQERLSARGGS